MYWLYTKLNLNIQERFKKHVILVQYVVQILYFS